MLHSLQITGYKNTKNIRLDALAKVNYLVGKNSSGKSSILECLKIVEVVLNDNVHSGVNVPGLTEYVLREDVKISLYFDNSKYFTVNIPQNTTINIGNGNFGIVGDPLTINGSSIATENDTRRIVVKKQTGKAVLIAYVTSFSAKIDNGDYVIKPDDMGFDFNNVLTISDTEIVEFLNKYHPLEDDQLITDISSTIRGDKAIQFSINKKENNVLIRKIAFTQLSGGLRALTKFYFGITSVLNSLRNDRGYIKIICIDEPENGFHPGLQKKIPQILNEFVEKDPNLMFIVTTHSPFIVSEASNSPDNKTYLIDKGSTVNLALDNVDGSKGYSGSRSLNVVAEMLGAGFGDLSSMPITQESITVIYCEGSTKIDVKDSELYRLIFPDKIFVSCGGLQDARMAYNLARSTIKFVFGESASALALVDRSCSSDDVKIGPLNKDVIIKTSASKLIFTDEERIKFINSDKANGLKMLNRKEIENYIFDPIVVNLLSEKSKINIKDYVIDYVTGEVKDRVSAPKEIKIKLAELIYEHRKGKTAKIYNELLKCLE